MIGHFFLPFTCYSVPLRLEFSAASSSSCLTLNYRQIIIKTENMHWPLHLQFRYIFLWPSIRWRECQKTLKQTLISLLLFTKGAKCWNSKSSGNRRSAWFTSCWVKYDHVRGTAMVCFCWAEEWQHNYNDSWVLITNSSWMAQKVNAGYKTRCCSFTFKWTNTAEETGF